MNPPPALRLTSIARFALSALIGALAAAAAGVETPASPPAKPALGGAGGPVPAAAVTQAPPRGPAAAGAVSEEAQGLLRLGATLTDRGDYTTAEIAYWQILNAPQAAVADQKSALLGIAHMFRKEGALTKAAAIYERFLKDFPNDERVPDALLDLGRTQREMSAYHLAISRFYSVINSTLKFPTQGFEHYESLAKTAQFEIAQTHFEAGEYAEAGKYFSKVRLLDLAPSDRAQAHFMAAFSLQLAGDREASIALLKAYLDQWPDDKNGPEARYLLATTLRQLGRAQEALRVTLDLLREEHGRNQADPRRWAYWQRRTGNQIANELFQGGDIFNALAIYKGLSNLAPDADWRLPILYQIGLCDERLRLVDDARGAYRTIIAAAQPVANRPASADAIELGRMAAWRLAHLDWRDSTEKQFTLFFSTGGAAPKPGPADQPTPPAPRPL